MAKFQANVIYPKGSLRSGADPSPSPYRIEDRLMPIEFDADENLRDADPRHLLEIIYRMMNAVDGSYCERYLQQYKERSMMIGDFIELFGKQYKCHIAGWLPVS